MSDSKWLLKGIKIFTNCIQYFTNSVKKGVNLHSTELYETLFLVKLTPFFNYKMWGLYMDLGVVSTLNQSRTLFWFSAIHFMLAIVLSMDWSTARVPEPKPTSALSALNCFSCHRKHGINARVSQTVKGAAWIETQLCVFEIWRDEFRRAKGKRGLCMSRRLSCHLERFLMI